MQLGQWDVTSAYDTPFGVADAPPGFIPEGTSPDLATSISQFGQTLLTWDYARQINAINLERAKQGLAPINAPAVQVGIAQSTLTPILLLGGAALLMLAMRR